jgi:hypothetical protein
MQPILRTANTNANASQPSRAMDINALFTILWIVVQIASGFGFAAYTPSPELMIIAPAIVAVINIILRYLHVN